VSKENGFLTFTSYTLARTEFLQEYRMEDFIFIFLSYVTNFHLKRTTMMLSPVLVLYILTL